MRKRNTPWIAPLICCALLIAALIWAFGTGRSSSYVSPAPENPVSSPEPAASLLPPETKVQSEVTPQTPDAAKPSRPQGSGTIHATVTNRIGDTIANATIGVDLRPKDENESEAFRAEATTDAGGAALLVGLPSGYYVVKAEQAGQIGWATTALGGALPGASRVDIVLKPAGSISGHVVDPQRAPVAEATVEALDLMHNKQKVQRVTTDADGNFSFEALPISQYGLQAVATGYATTLSEQVEIDGPPVTIVLGKGGRLSGEILRVSDRTPVTGVTVALTADDYKGVTFSAVSDVQGKFQIEHIPPGAALLTCDDPRYTFDPPQSTLDILPDALVHVELLAEDGARVAGQVYDPTTEKPVVGAVVKASNLENATRVWRSAPTDAEGNYDLPGLPAGSVRVSLDRVPPPYTRGLYESEEIVALAPGEVVDGLDFEVPSDLTVCGVVVDEADLPVAGATISLSSADPRDGAPQEFEHATSDAKGAFCFANVIVNAIPTAGGGFKQGAVVLEANHRGTRSELLSLPEVSESVSDVVLKLLPRSSGVIAGQVVDERGNPAVASIRLSKPVLSNEFDRRLGQTDADGYFLFQDLAPGDFEIWMAPYNGTGYNAGKKMALALTLADGQRVTDLRLVVSEGGVITGTLTDEAGTPLQGAMIEAWDEQGEEVSGAFTDREGNFRITGLEGEQFELRPRSDVAGGDWSVPAQAGEHVAIEIPSGPSADRAAREQTQIAEP